MSKLKKPVELETTFAIYTIDELIGEGGAGRVFGGRGPDNVTVAVKILNESRASTDHRKRFKNEIAFLLRNNHANIVNVIDHGVARTDEIKGPFYVMPRYSGNLRTLMKSGISPEKVIQWFVQVLDGVEAAHLKEVVHRDLKPENILYDEQKSRLAIADFGIARFTEDQVATMVETKPAQRMANFQYAAPEQRTVGALVSKQSDIYAIGLILNEMFTGAVPVGTEYKTIGQVSGNHAFLDPIVAQCLRQTAHERPESIAAIKSLIQRYEVEAITTQRLSAFNNEVVKEEEIDDPLASDPPRLVGAEWDNGRLTLTLDRTVHDRWVQALRNMGGYSSVSGKGPERFEFRGNTAVVPAQEHEAQNVINYFKQWLPRASVVLKQRLEALAKRQRQEQIQKLQQAREAEERRLRVNRNLKI